MRCLAVLKMICCLVMRLLTRTRRLLAGMSTILIVNILNLFSLRFCTICEEWQSPETRRIKSTPLLAVHLAQLQLSCYSHQYSLSGFTEAYMVAYIIMITHIICTLLVLTGVDELLSLVVGSSIMAIFNEAL